MTIYYSVHVTSSSPTNPLSIIVSITFHCVAIKSSKLIRSKYILLSFVSCKERPTRHYDRRARSSVLDQKILMYFG